MKGLAPIFYKRLERIREELDSYVDSHALEESIAPYASVDSDFAKVKSSGGVLEKFLNCFQLSDEDEEWYDDDYCEDEAVCFDEEEEQNLSELQIKKKQHFDIDKVLEKKEETFSYMLLRLIDEKGLKDSEVYKRANIDRRLFSKIRGDEDYVPSKKTAIAFCLALHLEMNETKKLLETAGYTLSASSRFDLIIMYLIEKQEYNVHFANIVLDDYGEGTLSR